MASCLVIHEVREYPKTQEEWLGLWESIWRKTSGATHWRGTFYSPEEDRLYCLWDSDQVEDIVSCFERTELDRLAPIEQILVGVYFDVTVFGERAV